MTTQREDVELMPESEFNFELFKKQFMFVAYNEYGACQSFLRSLEKANNMLEFKRVIYSNNEDFAEHIGVDLDDDSFCDNCSSLESDVNRLEGIVERYEGLDSSISDQYKLEAFIKHRNDYTFLEFEELMKRCRLLVRDMC